jgi:hypothetical protein
VAKSAFQGGRRRATTFALGHARKDHISPWRRPAEKAALASTGEVRDLTLDHGQQGAEVERAVVAHAVDEERRSAVHAATDTTQEILSDPGGVDVAGEFAGKSGSYSWLDIFHRNGPFAIQHLPV